jgi:pyruvate dehydrogenase E2 component (dihydrolipoamide acetyltransferase)
VKSVLVPDIGNFNAVEVIEVNVKVGDQVEKEQTLITLETEKASMEVPSSDAGVVKAIHIKVGDKVKKGDVIVELEQSSSFAAEAPSLRAEGEATQDKSAPQPDTIKAPAPASLARWTNEGGAPAPNSNEGTRPPLKKGVDETGQRPVEAGGFKETANSNEAIYASPAVRRLARELGVDLTRVPGTARKGRIQKEDLQDYVKKRLSGDQGNTGSGLPQMPEIDFTQFGEVAVEPLSRIKKLTAINLHRNWVLIPHVTQFDEADITELEEFRNSQKDRAQAQGFKLTPLVFMMKAVVAALKQFPQFNSSLSADGQQLILKKYFHLGVAVDTPNGLVVPVIRNVDSKGLFELAKELGEVSAKARDGKLTAQDMQGSSFTISSLGGVGGTAFTPIVNAPDVAILGVSRSQMKPIYQNGEFVPRLMLPLSLSYDHRVIDGAQAAAFTTFLSGLLSDIRRVLL